MTQLPIPRPQAGVVDTYVRPNPTQPAGPVLLGPGFVEGSLLRNDTSDALRRLNNALMQYGPSLVASQAEIVKQEEEIRLARMDTEAVRADLMTQARQMEKSGKLMSGSNPYRLMAIQEHLAVRTMQEEYEPLLAANLTKFASPDNPEDAGEFALSEFNKLNLPGYFGKAKAASLYQSMTSRWMAQVNQQRNVKVQERNSEDLSDSLYSLWKRSFNDPAFSTGDAAKSAKELMDQYYDLTGQSGRVEAYASFAALIASKGREAALDGDTDDIDTLMATVESLRGEEGKDLKWSKEFDSQFDELIVQLEDLRIRAEAKAKDDYTDDIAAAMASVVLQAREQNTYDGSPEGPLGLLLSQELEARGVPVDERNIALVDLPGHLKRYREFVREDVDAVTKLQYEAVSLSYEDFIANLRGAIASGVVSPETATGLHRLASNHSLMADQRRTAVLQDAGSTMRIAAEQTDTLMKDAAESVGDLEVGVMGLPQEVQDILVQRGADAARQLPGTATAEERGAVTRDAVEAEVAKIRRFIKPNQDPASPTFYDTDAMREFGLSEELVESFERVNLRRAEEMTPLAPFDPEQGTPTAENLKLMTVWWDIAYDDFVSLADNMGGYSLAGSMSEAQSRGVRMSSSAEAFKQNPKYAPFGTNYPPRPARVEEDGLYFPRGGGRHIESRQIEYRMAVRLSPKTLDELRRGKTNEGLSLSYHEELTNPSLSVMADPKTFLADLEMMAGLNRPDMEEDELLSLIQDSNLGQAYLAYREWRQERAVGFGQFVEGQIRIMYYAGAPANSTLLTKLNNPVTEPAGQENAQ